MIRFIATDFDGTIHSGETVPRISSELANWLRFAQGNGVRWAICSGRQMNEEFAAELRSLNGDPWPDFIVSVEREIHVRDNGWYRPDPAWNTRCAADHVALFAEARGLLERTRGWLGTQTRAHVYEDRWSPLNLIASSPEEADLVHRHLTDQYRVLPDLTLVRNHVYFRHGHRRYTKGTALGELVRQLGLKQSEVFAAGDHYNDLTMLDGVHAGMVAAPANAIPEVKAAVAAAGGYVARQPFGLGVLEALRHFEG